MGSGCAINVRWDLATYRYDGGTFATRSLQLDHVTEFLYDSESRMIYAGDPFEYVGYGLYDTAQYYDERLTSGSSERPMCRVTFGWTDIACP